MTSHKIYPKRSKVTLDKFSSEKLLLFSNHPVVPRNHPPPPVGFQYSAGSLCSAPPSIDFPVDPRLTCLNIGSQCHEETSGRMHRKHPGHQVAHAAYPLWAMPARAEATHRRWQDPDNLETILALQIPVFNVSVLGRRAITASRREGRWPVIGSLVQWCNMGKGNWRAAGRAGPPTRSSQAHSVISSSSRCHQAQWPPMRDDDALHGRPHCSESD